MAKQKGIIKIDGTLGDITFYKSQDGYLVKEKSAISKERIMTDPAFVRTRENLSEFGRAGKASKVLRNAFREMLQTVKDSRSASRLTKEMMNVIKADAVSIRGLRNVIDGETELLKNFNFNSNAILSATVYAAYTAAINRVTGEHTVNVPAFNSSQMIVWPDGATHCQIISAGADINFTDEVHLAAVFESAFLPKSELPTAALTITHTLAANSTNPLFLLLGIRFSQEVNSVQYPLRNGAFNALSIVEVEGV